MMVEKWDVCEQCRGSGTVCYACAVQDWENCAPDDCPNCQGLGRVPLDNVVGIVRQQLVSYLEEELFLGLEGVVDYDWLAEAVLLAAALEEQTSELS